MTELLTVQGFLLLKQWRDTPQGLVFDLWVSSNHGPVRALITGQETVLFVTRSTQTEFGRRAELPLKTMGGKPVDGLYFHTQRELQRARSDLRNRGATPLEADIKPVERYLMERFVTGGIQLKGRASRQNGVLTFSNPRITSCDYRPHFHVLSLDIETDGFDGPLLSWAAATHDKQTTFLVKDGDERQALARLQDWVQAQDPDVLVGWNVVDFDLDYLNKLAKRLKMQLRLGRGGAPLNLIEPQSPEQPRVARVPGRIVLDGIATLRSCTMMFESFELDHVAFELLGRGKKIAKTGDAAEEIRRMAREDPDALLRYNLEDCCLVLDIFKKARLLDFAIERQSLTGLLMDRRGGSVAAFDQLYLPRLHRAGYVAPSVGDTQSRIGSPGGYVMDSVPGLYQNVIVLDFKSLYPSIIRTFLVDPLGLMQPGQDPVPGFEGAQFARDDHILPELVRSLWEARDRAKRNKNEALSRAIKIMMNSFYGVLGTPGCRFFDHRLVSSITLRGHQIIQDTRDYLEKKGARVIYGDTDSLFVLLDETASPETCATQGAELATELTEHLRKHLLKKYRIDSFLELEYECHFHRFLMPTMRGSELGTKKRYAGSITNAAGNLAIVFKGMEAVRTDWTPLARNFQRELFALVFSDQPHQDYIRQVVDDLLGGKLDHQLVYRKRLRRALHEYTKNIPPHAQAARKQKAPGRVVEYLITVNGPEPIEDLRSPLDYSHYLERQLKPAAQSLLQELGEDFETIGGRQLKLF